MIFNFCLLFSYDCDDREAEDDELNGNDEDEGVVADNDDDDELDLS